MESSHPASMMQASDAPRQGNASAAALWRMATKRPAATAKGNAMLSRQAAKFKTGGRPRGVARKGTNNVAKTARGGKTRGAHTSSKKGMTAMKASKSTMKAMKASTTPKRKKCNLKRVAKFTFCPTGHKLAVFETPRVGYTCNVCHISLAVGAFTFNCQQCAWDRCSACNLIAAGAREKGMKLRKAAFKKAKEASKMALRKQRAAAMAAARELAVAEQRAKVAAAHAAKERAQAEKKAKIDQKKSTFASRAAAKLASKRVCARIRGAKVSARNAAARARDEAKAKAAAVKAAKEACGSTPKRPAAGAWGVFLEEQRPEIKQSLPVSHSITDIAKAASGKFNALTKEERIVYEERYQAKMSSYRVALDEYRRAAVANGLPLEATPSRKRRLCCNLSDESQAKSTTPSRRVPEEYLAPLDADVLKEASGLGCEAALRSLACRSDVVAAKLPAAKLLRALRAAGGSVKKAGEALLRA